MPSKYSPLSNPFFVFGFVYAVPFIIEVIFAEWTDREFHIHLGWAGLSIAYCYIFRFKPVIALLTSFFIVTSCMDIGYAMTFGGVFTSSSVEAMAQTNAEEASEFLDSYFDLGTVLVVLFYFSVSALLLIKLSCHGLPVRKAYRGLALFFFIVLCGFIFQGLIVKHRYTKLLPGIVGAYPAYLGGTESLSAEIDERAQLSGNNAGKFVSALELPQTYVFIIGEATTRAHMSLYGYQRETNPLLSKRSDLIAFDNVISNFVQTQPSLRYALTQATTDGNLSYLQALSIVDAANIAGFEAWWISNQQPLRGTYSAIGEQAKHVTFISNLYFGREVGRFDGFVLPELDKALAEKTKKKAIFIHLMGSHLQYDKRYPESFKQFDSPPYFAYKDDVSSKQRHYIDSYDNSILYNDWVVNEIVSRLKTATKGQVAALNYMSDHGEEVFDTIDFKGHGPDTVTKNSLEIPFLVWLSDTYKTQLATQTQYLKENTHRPYMLDHYFHFSLSMMNVLSPFYVADFSLFSKKPKEDVRVVYGKDYDADLRFIK